MALYSGVSRGVVEALLLREHEGVAQNTRVTVRLLISN